ncbi:MAG: hypothetical protein Q7J70_05255, partial [Thermodesulfovibrionales bacterium]|nr:hypothetical protein [Thermodesulfovibrionales bacterium]
QFIASTVKFPQHGAEPEVCPGYEAKLAEARGKAVNGLVAIHCNQDCNRTCKAKNEGETIRMPNVASKGY